MGCASSSSGATHDSAEVVEPERENRKVELAWSNWNTSRAIPTSASSFQSYKCQGVQDAKHRERSFILDDQPQHVSIACGRCETLNTVPVAASKFKCYQCELTQKIDEHSCVNQMQTRMECGLRAFNNMMQAIRQEPASWREFDDIARSLEKAEQSLCHSDSVDMSRLARSDADGNFSIEVLQMAAQQRGYDLDTLQSYLNTTKSLRWRGPEILGVVLASGSHFWCIQKHCSSPKWRTFDSLSHVRHSEASSLKYSSDEHLLSYLLRQKGSLFSYILTQPGKQDFYLDDVDNLPTLLTTGRHRTKSDDTCSTQVPSPASSQHSDSS